MKKLPEVAEVLRCLHSTAERLTLIYMWVKQDVISRGTFIDAISLINEWDS
jgi:hypothetical protein